MNENGEIIGGTINESNAYEKNIEDKMIDEYIGQDAIVVKTKGVNWISAVIGQAIGPVWFFYKRAHLLGFFFIFVSFVIGNLASKINFEQASYVMFFIYLFVTNKLYLWDVKRKVRKIIEKNPMVSDTELLEIARQKGKESILAVIVYIVLFILYFFLIMMAYMTLMRMATEIYG